MLNSMMTESRVITAKILVTPHQGILYAPRTGPKKLTDFPLVVRSASSTETIFEELTFNESLEFQAEESVLPTVSCGSVGSSHALTVLSLVLGFV